MSTDRANVHIETKGIALDISLGTIVSSLDQISSTELQRLLVEISGLLLKRKEDPLIPLDDMSSQGINTLVQRGFDLLSARHDNMVLKVKKGTDEQVKSFYEECSVELDRREIECGIPVKHFSSRYIAQLVKTCLKVLCARDDEFEIDFDKLRRPALDFLIQKCCESLKSRAEDFPAEFLQDSGSSIGIHLSMLFKRLKTRKCMRSALKQLNLYQISWTIDECCAYLASQEHPLPQHIAYQKPVRPSLLTIPQELRNEIYKLCIPEHISRQNCASGLLSCDFHSVDLTRHFDRDRPSKRRRLDSGVAAFSSSERLPHILVKFHGTAPFPALAYTCSSLREDIVAGSFASHPLSIKIDCTNLNPTDFVADFWEFVFPEWHLDMIHNVNIELRCSIEQWYQMRKPMCDRLNKLTKIGRGMTTRARVKIRAILDFPRSQQHAYLEKLPSSFDTALKQEAGRTWFKAHVNDIQQEFLVMQTTACVQQIQIFNLDGVIRHSAPELYRRADVEYPVVHFRADQGWETLRGTRYDWANELRGYVQVKDEVIQDM